MGTLYRVNDQTDQQLLRDYAERQSEAAFAAIVQRYVDLVYSAAVRMVGDAHAAKDVTQGVFVALAQNARQLTDRPALAGWLHCTARNLAGKAVRADVRRRAREKEAAVMNELLSANPDTDWEHIAPHLDEALGELSEPDRDAVLLRYFKNHDLRTVGATLGISDDAAQKRVSRAVERLREFFAKRGVTVGAGGLAVVISANAVQAAPVGLAVTVSTAAALTGTTLATTTTVTATKAIAMTALQKTIVTATIAVLAGAGIYEARQVSQMRDQVQTLQQQQSALIEQNRQLFSAHDEITNRLAGLLTEKSQSKANSNQYELLKLRGEVTRLRNDNQSSDPNQSEVKNLLARVNNLKERLRQHPEQSIPELQFANQKDWLAAVDRRLETETDFRKAMADLRSSAKGRFVNLAAQALKEYSKQNGGNYPTDLAELKPYFKETIDDAVFARYEIMRQEDVVSVGLGGDKIVGEKAPVDAEFDSRLFFSNQGNTGGSSFNQSPLETLIPAARAFAKANLGKVAKDFSELAPYVKTDEQRAALQTMDEATAAFKSDHNGEAPKEFSELSPYLKPTKKSDQ